MTRQAADLPAGSGAGRRGQAIDRERVATELGFGAVTDNSIDAVSDRDYAIEAIGAVAILVGHLSRLAGELVLWSTPYVGFVRLDDAFSSGSSMLPNKRNPDSAELVRARAARVEGDLVTVLTGRGLPLAYHRDLKEARQGPVRRGGVPAQLCLNVMRGVLETVAFDRDRMRAAAERGHARAVILADRLVRGVPFRVRIAASGDSSAMPTPPASICPSSPTRLRDALPELGDDGASEPRRGGRGRRRPWRHGATPRSRRAGYGPRGHSHARCPRERVGPRRSRRRQRLCGR